MSTDPSQTTTTDETDLNLDDRCDRWGHGREDFTYGLEHGASAMQLEYMAVYKFPDRKDAAIATILPYGDGQFAWIQIMREHGWEASRIKEFLIGVLTHEDPNSNFAEAMRELIRPRAELAWEYLEPDELLRLIEKRIAHLADEVMKHRRTIAYAFAVTRKVKPEVRWAGSEIETVRRREAAMVAAGEADALILVNAAVPHIRMVMNAAVLESVLKLGLPTQLRLLLQCISYEASRCPLGSRFEAKLAIHLALAGGLPGKDGESVKRALADTIRWLKMDYVPPKRPEWNSRGRDRGDWAESKYVPAKDADPEHAVKAYRWFLAFIDEEPLGTEPWMSQGTTPQRVRETTIWGLDRDFRKAVEGQGWKFVRVERDVIPNTGESQLVAKATDGPYTGVFVHDERGQRHEHIADGMEVMVPAQMNAEPLFRRGPVTGWRYELHPVKPVTQAMIEAKKGKI